MAISVKGGDTVELIIDGQRIDVLVKSVNQWQITISGSELKSRFRVANGGWVLWRI